MKINWAQMEFIRGNLKSLRENLFYTRNEVFDINSKLDQILEEQKKDFTKSHKLVVIYDGIRDCKIYKDGKDITSNVTKLTIEGGNYPEIIESVVNDEEN